MTTTTKAEVVALIKTPRGMFVNLKGIGLIPLGLAGLSVDHRHLQAKCVQCGELFNLCDLTELGHCQDVCACEGQD